MNYIDMETYPRRSHFEFFRSLAFPYTGLTANVDVTAPVGYARQRGKSPFLACLWVAARGANAVPELRQRIVGDRIAQFDHCNTAHTVALPDHTFCNCNTDCRRTLDEFLDYGKQRQAEAAQTHGFVTTQEDETGLIFVSCVPWVRFTQCIQPAPIPADSNPRIVFGQFFEENGRILMPLHIQVNHALVDGWHMGEFFRCFQEIADNCGK